MKNLEHHLMNAWSTGKNITKKTQTWLTSNIEYENRLILLGVFTGFITGFLFGILISL
jgi:hypothetical protein